ncbi:hypothetical protein D3C83_06250 [compost metagenome]
MPDAREVRLRREGEQVVGPGRSRRHPGPHRCGVEPQLGIRQRQVFDERSAGAGELADAVDRVVIVGAQEQPPARRERKALAHVLQGARRIGRKDGGVVGAGVEPLEHGAARPFDDNRRRTRGTACGVRVPEYAAGEHRGVLTQLRFRVQARARVVEIQVAGRVETSVLGGPQPVDMRGRRVVGIAVQELVERHDPPTRTW